MSVTGCGVKIAIDALDVLCTISAAQIHFTFETGNVDLAIPRVQVNLPFPRHVDVDVHSVIA